MKIIPPFLDKSVDSNAEKKVFDLLSRCDLGEDIFVLHSFNLSEHIYKQWAEIDFLIVGRKGILVLEVKGGRVSFSNGIWEFRDRFEKVHRKTEGPFRQAKSAMYSLQRMIKKKFANDFMHKKILYGWGVVFPDFTFDYNTPEMPAHVVCDENRFNIHGFKKYIKSLYDYWLDKPGKTEGLSSSEVSKIITFLRPKFELAKSLKSHISDSEQLMVSMTEEQYHVLDMIEDNLRVICKGGAGTGKTFLLMEEARRANSKNKNVLIVCHSKLLAEYLENQIRSDNLTVCTIDCLKKSPKNHKYDCDLLLVDEGQDILSFEIIDLLDKKITKGLDSVKSRIFLDTNNQANVDGTYETEAYEYLVSEGWFQISLKHNCRNTEQIVHQTQLLTGADIGDAYVKGSGPKTIIKVENNNDAKLKLLTRQIDIWAESVDSLGDIALLSPLEFEKSLVFMLEEKIKRHIVDLNKNPALSVKNRIVFSAIKDFKGLEAKIVALLDLEYLEGLDNEIPLLYVGMTRANTLLCMCMNSEYKKHQENIIKKNIMKILEKENDNN